MQIFFTNTQNIKTFVVCFTQILRIHDVTMSEDFFLIFLKCVKNRKHLCFYVVVGLYLMNKDKCYLDV